MKALIMSLTIDNESFGRLQVCEEYAKDHGELDSRDYQDADD